MGQLEEWRRGFKALRADTLAKLKKAKKAIHELQLEVLPLGGAFVVDVSVSLLRVRWGLRKVTWNQMKVQNQPQTPPSNDTLQEPEDGVTNYTRRRHNSSSDGVTYFKTASARTDSNADLEDSFYDGSVFSSCYLFLNPFSSTTMGDKNHIRTLVDYSRPSHEGYRNTIDLPEENNVDPSPHGRILLLDSLLNSFHREGPQNSATKYPDVPTTSWRISIRSMDSRTIDQSASGKLHDLNPEESWAILEDLALCDSESWNDPRDFAKPVKAIALPQDVPSTSDCHLFELKNQV
ncbi:hypothetical protein Tco_0651592 [Tanacetum coccineum]|uniref:Uncharacterized protein n=1 Tax=Tanacetum coccineum TaxID=301880 RepID=A0ABQ4WVH3_9ASTR